MSQVIWLGDPRGHALAVPETPPPLRGLESSGEQEESWGAEGPQKEKGRAREPLRASRLTPFMAGETEAWSRAEQPKGTALARVSAQCSAHCSGPTGHPLASHVSPRCLGRAFLTK